MTTISVYDRFEIPATSRVRTGEGYLSAPATIAMADNVQPYLAKELGLDKEGMAADRVVRLYRPADEVFAPDALASFEGQPVTFRHPPEPVTAKNWKKYSVGDAHGVRANGNGVAADRVIVRDHAAVAGVIDGTCEMSNGYNFELDMTPGQTADGRAYDGVQRKIRGNHIAIVERARGGRSCRIADHDHPSHQEKRMATRNIVVFDTKFNEIDDGVATLFERIEIEQKGKLKVATDEATTNLARATTAETALASERDKNAKLVTDHATALDEAKKKIPTAEQIETMAKERAQAVTDAQIETLADERAQVVTAAGKMVEGFDTAKKTVAAIRTGVLTAILAGDSAVKGMVTSGLGGVAPDKADAGLVKAVFAMAAAAVPEKRTGASDEELEAQKRALTIDALGGGLAGGGGTGMASTGFTAHDMLRARENNGGKTPSWAEAKK